MSHPGAMVSASMWPRGTERRATYGLSGYAR